MNNQQQFDALDLLSIMSFGIGYLNLIENRQQSAANDVSAANDKQAQYLLQELGRRFEEQNEMLTQILEVLQREKSTGKE
ncbi:MAG: hypothetical protein ACI4W2_10645 [Eubacterium sp.]